MNIKYKVTRFIYGLILLIIALKSLNQSNIEHNTTVIKNNMTSFFAEEGIYSLINFSFLSQEMNNFIKRSFYIKDIIIDISNDLIIFIYLLLSFGALLAMFGYSISKFFIVSALVVDLVFVHNLNFFATDSSKGLMIKYVVLLGGALFIK